MVLRPANGLRCDRCGRLVRGSDVEEVEAGHRLICAACHHLVLSFEVT
jgi:DNA-directed RNA polymerase subunit RPC12/RpoP